MAWPVLPFRGSKLRQGMWFRWSRRHSVLLLPGLSTAHAFEVRWHRWLLGMSALLSQESELQYAGHDIQLIQQTTCAKGTGGLLCMTQLKRHLRFDEIPGRQQEGILRGDSGPKYAPGPHSRNRLRLKNFKWQSHEAPPLRRIAMLYFSPDVS